MPALLQLPQDRLNRELAHANLALEGERQWRRVWMRVYLQCLGLMLVGYVLFGWSWALGGDEAHLLSAGAMVVAYVLPFFRLIAFFLRHADQF